MVSPIILRSSVSLGKFGVPTVLILLLSFFSATTLSAQQNVLQSLHPPVIFKGTDSIAYRDPAVLYHNKMFYLFFTMVKSEADGKVYSYTAMSTSKDLRKWSEKKILTPRNQNLDYSQPGKCYPVQKRMDTLFANLSTARLLREGYAQIWYRRCPSLYHEK